MTPSSSAAPSPRPLWSSPPTPTAPAAWSPSTRTGRSPPATTPAPGPQPTSPPTAAGPSPPLATPYTNAEGNAGRRTPITHSTTARPARADTITKLLKTYNLPRLRLHRGTRTDTSRRGFTARELNHPELGHVVELTVYGPDAYQRESDHRLMRTVLRHEHVRYEVTDHHTHLLVRRPSDAELHAAADRAAARVAPHLAALRKAFLPSDMIEPIADALAHLAPDTYAPRSI
ncbi:hypothetical protein AB0D98_19515 [Streptomyces sp. NPDC047987]|uniref:hypothetical protein n=1 Tax=unclassified Streptomyces TaxID=2593676 RepID=UPI003447CF49